MRGRVLAALALVSAVAAAGIGAAASADEAGVPSALEVAAVDTSDYPAVGLTVVAPEELPEPEAIQVSEDGTPRHAQVAALDDRPLEVVVVVDSSEMVGDQLRTVGAAVTEFALRLPSDTQLGLVAAGGRPQVAVAPTTDTGTFVAALAELEPRGRPAVLQAVPVALEQLSPDGAGRRVVVAIGGGGNRREREEIDRATRSARATDALLFAIAVADDAAAELAATGRGVDERIDALAEVSPILTRIAEDLANVYRIDFTASGTGPTELGIAVDGEPAHRATVTVDMPDPGTDDSARGGGEPIIDWWVPVTALAAVLVLAVAAVFALAAAMFTRLSKVRARAVTEEFTAAEPPARIIDPGLATLPDPSRSDRAADGDPAPLDADREAPRPGPPAPMRPDAQAPGQRDVPSTQLPWTEETARYLTNVHIDAPPPRPGTVVHPDAEVGLRLTGSPGEDVALSLEAENGEDAYVLINPAVTPLVSAPGAVWFPVLRTSARILGPGDRKELHASIHVPDDLPAGSYRGALLLHGFRATSVPLTVAVSEPT